MRATDAGALAVDDTLFVTVIPINDAPVVAVVMPDTVVLESSPPADNYRDLNAVFSDVEDGTALNFIVQSNSNSGLVATAIDADSALDLTFTPSQSGVATIVIRATDTGALSVDDTLVVTVNPVNDPPVVVSAMPDTTVNEDNPTITAYRDLNDVFSDEEDGTALNYSILSNDNPALVTPTINGADSTLDLAFGADQSGSATIVVRAIDSGPLQVDDTLVVTVNPVNDPPVVASALPDTTVSEDDPPILGFRDLNGVFSDVEDGTVLNYVILSNDNPALVMPTINGADSTLDLAFGAELSGSATIVVRATDAGALAVDDTLVVTVNPINDAPVVVAAMPDTAVIENSPPADNYRDLNDVFSDVEDGTALNYVIQSNTNSGLVGTSIDADSALDLTFTPVRVEWRRL